MSAPMAQEGVFGSVVSQQARSWPLLVARKRFPTVRCTKRHLKLRQHRICGAYQQEVEETFRRKAPSTPPGPDTKRPPPPPPPPPPAPLSGQVTPRLFAALMFLPPCCNYRLLSYCHGLQFGGQTRRTMLALVGICSVAYGYNVTQHPDAPPGIELCLPVHVSIC